jgi:mannose-6-phosphate isomerase-like protein (cupin superfamily)
MPVFKAGEGQAPAWSELEMFEHIELTPGEVRDVAFRGPKERYVRTRGEVEAIINGAQAPFQQYGVLDVPAGAKVRFRSQVGGAVMRLCGHWGEEIGGTGCFPVFKADEPKNPGDPTSYERNASFDNHYHDCDEYWIVFQGRGRAVSEGKAYEVGPGDCIATGRGQHHDFSVVYEDVAAVFFETTLVGKKRLGHLWNHAHGPAEPDNTRI